MNRKKRVSPLLVMLTPVLLLMLVASCGKGEPAAKPDQPAATAEPAAPTDPVQPVDPSDSPDPQTVSGRQDGERFEETIILEGTEETVRYEHVRSDALGFEMDFDYEQFNRISGPDFLRFVSAYDSAEIPDNYLEVKCNPKDAETVAAAVSAYLSLRYETVREPLVLEGAESGIRIYASGNKDGAGIPDLLQTVYIIPAADGCRVATAHYTFEGAEGFGRRFAYMMNTFLAIPAQGEKRMSEESALAAIERYCCISNPALVESAEAEDYPFYWDVSTSDEQEIVVLFRSYTGAQIRYHIDPVSGDTYAMEFVPGISEEETQTDERLNAWEYAF